MTVTTSAIAMATEITFDQELFKAWGLGGVEFYAELEQLAEKSYRLASELGMIAEFSGVWEYEVDELLGKYIEQTFKSGKDLTHYGFNQELGRLAIDFLGNSGAADVMRGTPTVVKHTGYTGTT